MGETGKKGRKVGVSEGKKAERDEGSKIGERNKEKNWKEGDRRKGGRMKRMEKL